MPLYEYECAKCNKQHELLIRNQDEAPVCPNCGSNQLSRLLSVPASPNTNGSPLPMAGPGDCGRPACGAGG